MQVKVTVMKTVRDTLLPVGMPFTDILIEFGFGSAYLCFRQQTKNCSYCDIFNHYHVHEFDVGDWSQFWLQGNR